MWFYASELLKVNPLYVIYYADPSADPLYVIY